MEILNSSGKVIRTFSSEKDSTYQKHNGGGPPPAPVLPQEQGLNRFVWDLNYPIMEGIPGVYIEAGFQGHKAPPGNYTIRLKLGEETVMTEGKIVATPGFDVSMTQYEEFDVFMSEMEAKLNEMHQLVNQLFKVQQQLKTLLPTMEAGEAKQAGEVLLKELITWDEEMIQRKSQAYDDVENFPNKFTAEYLYLINQTNSVIPRVNQGSRDRRETLDAQWNGLRSRAQNFVNVALPNYNKTLWNAGIGAIQSGK